MPRLSLRTASQYCGFLVEFHNVDLTKMTTDTADRVTICYIPQEDGSVSSRGREFAIIMRTEESSVARVNRHRKADY